MAHPADRDREASPSGMVIFNKVNFRELDSTDKEAVAVLGINTGTRISESGKNFCS
ncbi:MAG: hypothetical protein LBB74_03125 [Chitinispirillales bacterium]|jgi:hypothetical protein|nr:hypothetical protein [Chitinispirillales bacterium]